MNSYLNSRHYCKLQKDVSKSTRKTQGRMREVIKNAVWFSLIRKNAERIEENKICIS